MNPLNRTQILEIFGVDLEGKEFPPSVINSIKVGFSAAITQCQCLLRQHDLANSEIYQKLMKLDQ